MQIHSSRLALFLTFAAVASGLGLAQQADRPLTNADLISMVESKLPESVIVSAIQARPGKFDTSSSGLIALHQAGLTENELNAVIMASKAGPPVPRPADASLGSPAAGAPTTSSNSRLPKVYVIQNGASQELPLEKTQLAETKTKPSSIENLAADSAVTQAMQSGINTAAFSAATHMNSGIGGASVEEAGGIFSGMMSRRRPVVTYVWGVPRPASGNVLKSVSPSFSIDFSRVQGINPDEYEPAIVKLTPAQNTCRLVGATQGKEDASSSPAADWEMYSHFVEEPVNTQPEKLGTGQYKMAPASPLAPGEYGLVLRPISRSKKFSGGDVARAQGDGLMFDAVWSFQISADAE